MINKLEGGDLYSDTTRLILEKFHGAKVGKYTYGPCLTPGTLPEGSEIGAYCSIAEGLTIFRRNHPTRRITQHPFFYNSDLGYLAKDTINLDKENPLSILDDVWIGHGVTILPSCKFIGRGAVIGAGSIVTKSVENYSIVAGNPAKEIAQRFTIEEQKILEKSEWWKLSIADLLTRKSLITEDINLQTLNKFLDFDRVTSRHTHPF